MHPTCRLLPVLWCWGMEYEQNGRVLNSNCRWNLNFELQRFSPACELKQERKTRCCTRRSTGIRRPVPSYYEGTAHPIPVLLRVQHLVFLSCFSLQAGKNRWSSKFKIQWQLEFKTRPFSRVRIPHHHSTGKSLHVGCIQAQIQILVSNGHLPVWFSARIRLVVSWPP